MEYLQQDKELWRRIGESNQEAFAEIYRLLFKKFYNYGKKITDENWLLEDTIQETLIILWNKRHHIASIENPYAYFFSSFRHALFYKLNQQRKDILTTNADEEPAFSVENFIVSKERNDEMQKLVQDALIKLTSRQREAIFLRFFEEMSHEQISQILNITVKASYKIMGRALGRLKGHLRISIPVVQLLIIQHSN